MARYIVKEGKKENKANKAFYTKSVAGSLVLPADKKHVTDEPTEGHTVVFNRAYTGYVEPEVSVTVRTGEAPTPRLGRPLVGKDILSVAHDLN